MSEMIKTINVPQSSDIQIIGLDAGRGYLKAYSVVNNIIREAMFKSVIGDGREDKVEYKNYPDPIFISFEGMDYFVGDLAEKESYSAIRKSQDSKVSHTVQVLLAAALEKIAVKEKVKIMFGVPYKNYTMKTLREVQDTYKGKTIVVKNKLDGNSTKTITIEDVDIFREGDAALFHAIKGEVNKDKPVGLVNVGFRTLELSYFDIGFTFNDRLSDTVEYGNSTMLNIVRDQILAEEGVTKSVNEIDSSEKYDDKKRRVYALGSEKVNQIVEEHWINKYEMDLYLAGGTSLHLNPGDDFNKLEDAQMATAKGLFEIAKIKF